MARPLAIITEHLDKDAAAWLGEASRCEIVRCDSADAAFGDLLARAEALVIRTYTVVNEALLKRAPKLKVVGRAGVGLDNVDVAACKARGVTVVSTPDANTRAVVEYVFALLLDATRPRVFLEQSLEPSEWKSLRNELLAKKQLCELTLGIYGFGRIGTQVARAAAGLGMRAVYHDLLEIPESKRFGAAPVSRDELLRSADLLTVHVDGRKSNRNLIDGAAMRLMKPGVIFVNTSRGFVVHAAALAEFMRAHVESGAQALLDVHEPEPFTDAYPLMGISNVHLSAHIASSTALAHSNMSWVVRDVWRVLSGEQPEFAAEVEKA